MLDLRYSSQFKKDFKSCMKRGYNMNLLQQVIDILRIPAALPEKNHDHKLAGDRSIYRECHILPDWLLIYRYEENILLLDRTGSHADLFR